MIVIGIDPGAGQKKHGVAVYENGKLTRLSMMYRNEIVDEFRYKDCLFSIENVCSDNAVHKNALSDNEKFNIKRGRNVGMCQQSQIELMRDLDHYAMPYVLQKRSSKWKGEDSYKRKQPHEIKEFELVTGWTKRSNKDTRSAAYFGYIEVNKK